MLSKNNYNTHAFTTVLYLRGMCRTETAKKIVYAVFPHHFYKLLCILSPQSVDLPAANIKDSVGSQSGQISGPNLPP